MCRLQLIISLLLFASRVDKVVSVYVCVLEFEINSVWKDWVC